MNKREAKNQVGEAIYNAKKSLESAQELMNSIMNSIIDEKLWDKDICPNCGKHYNDLRQKNYDSNINPESGMECFELVCPECNETVDFIQNIYY
jgi:uncharacterized protein with PIN domain